MFDMLIGGVSSSGEDPHTTAAREVGEELGLTRAEGLSGPLFTAGVCTGYNRCVVTCFNYQVDLEVESITHQDSEVGWGGWVGREDVGRGVRDEYDVGVRGVLEGMGAGKVERIQWVPDGLIVYEKYKTYEAGRDCGRDRIGKT